MHCGRSEVAISELNLPATGAAAGELALVPPMLGTSQRLLNRDHEEVYFQVPLNPAMHVLRSVHMLQAESGGRRKGAALQCRAAAALPAQHCNIAGCAPCTSWQDPWGVHPKDRARHPAAGFAGMPVRKHTATLPRLMR